MKELKCIKKLTRGNQTTKQMFADAHAKAESGDVA